MYNFIKLIFNDFPLPKKYKKIHLSLTEHIEEINSWLDEQLKKFKNEEETSQNDKIFSNPNGKFVQFLVDSTNNHVKADENKLTLKSNSSFITVKANCGLLNKGKWMYEVQLHSKGIMQIGWCGSKCKFSQEDLGIGVGDTPASYGYDGSKKRIWNMQSKPYGTTFWRTGDIIGVCLDLDEESIEFYRNGKSLGKAFEHIVIDGPKFPAVSIAFGENLTANFGIAPFRFPVPNFKPLQDPPTKELQKCECLLMYLSDLAQTVSKVMITRKPREIKLANDALVSEDALVLIFGSMIVERLTPYVTNRYIVEALVFQMIKKLCILRSIQGKSPLLPGQEESTLGCLLTLLWDHLDHDDVIKLFEILMNYMESVYKEISNDADYERQRSIIVILTCLCNHTKTRKHLLKEILFRNNCLALFLYIKPPEEDVLEKLIPEKAIWTSTFGGNKAAFLAGCERINLCTNSLYNLQKNLLIALLRNNDGNEKQPSSRVIFSALFRKFLYANCVEHRMADLFQAMLHGYVITPTQPAVGLAFLCLLLDVLKAIWERDFANQPMTIEINNFFDGTLSYKSTDRVGGVVSYLRKVHRQQLQQRLGTDHQTMTEEYEQRLIQSELHDIYATFLVVSGTPSTGYSVVQQDQGPSTNPPVAPRTSQIQYKPGNSDDLKSIYELIDCCVLLYCTVAHKYVMLVADLRDNLAKLPECFKDLKSTEPSEQSCARFSFDDTNVTPANFTENMKATFYKSRSLLMVRKQAWYRAVSLNRNRRNLLVWLLNWIIGTADHCSQQGQLFVFLPEPYINIIPLLLDAILDFSFHDVQDQYNHTSELPLLKKTANFLAMHIADGRIVLAACKDAIIQSLGTLACHKMGMQALEQIDPNSQMALVIAILQPYENRAWGQTNWLLLRFWLGHGFAYREARPANKWNDGDVDMNLGLQRRRAKTTSYTGLLHVIAPACPSIYYQKLIVKILRDEPDYCSKFISSLLSQLNWSFSEFIQICQEIQPILLKETETPIIDSKQMKICTMCFELTISLIRALEMVISLIPDLFDEVIKTNGDILLNRVCQLVVQVLSRTTIPLGCFQTVVDSTVPELQHITHFPILSGTMGIFLGLMQSEMGNNDCIVKVPKVSRIFLTDPGFHIACLQFTLGEGGIPTSWQNIPRGNFDPNLGRELTPPAATLEFLIDTAMEERRSSIGSSRSISSVTPIVKFDFRSYPSHISDEEIEKIANLIELLQIRQSLLSEITVFSEESLCPICCARRNNATFEPCHHQSCENCIIQHLMDNHLCFYCKALVKKVFNTENKLIYETTSEIPSPPSNEYD